MAKQYTNTLSDVSASYPTTVYAPIEFKNHDSNGTGYTATESFTVPATPIAGLYLVELGFVLKKQVAPTITIDGVAVTVFKSFADTINAGEVGINWLFPVLKFAAADTGKAVVITYSHTGSVVTAGTMNRLQKELAATQTELDDLATTVAGISGSSDSTTSNTYTIGSGSSAFDTDMALVFGTSAYPATLSWSNADINDDRFEFNKTLFAPTVMSDILYGSGANITALSATNLASGFLASARLPQSGTWNLNSELTTASAKLYPVSITQSEYAAQKMTSAITLSGSGTTTITMAETVRVNGPALTVASGQTMTVTNLFSQIVAGPSNTGSGTLNANTVANLFIPANTTTGSNRYGLLVDSPTGGGSNWGIWNNGDMRVSGLSDLTTVTANSLATIALTVGDASGGDGYSSTIVMKAGSGYTGQIGFYDLEGDFGYGNYCFAFSSPIANPIQISPFPNSSSLCQAQILFGQQDIDSRIEWYAPTGTLKIITSEQVEINGGVKSEGIISASKLKAHNTANLTSSTATNSFAAKVVEVDTNYSVSDSDYLVLVNAISGPMTVSLPEPTAARIGMTVIIKKIDNVGDTLAISAYSATIDGESELYFDTFGQTLHVIAGNGIWYKV